MRIFHPKCLADQLATELHRTARSIGITYACVILRPALISGDTEAALQLCDELEQEASK